jgi:hypothetical protein
MRPGHLKIWPRSSSGLSSGAWIGTPKKFRSIEKIENLKFRNSERIIEITKRDLKNCARVRFFKFSSQC